MRVDEIWITQIKPREDASKEIKIDKKSGQLTKFFLICFARYGDFLREL